MNRRSSSLFGDRAEPTRRSISPSCHSEAMRHFFRRFFFTFEKNPLAQRRNENCGKSEQFTAFATSDLRRVSDYRVECRTPINKWNECDEKEISSECCATVRRRKGSGRQHAACHLKWNTEKNLKWLESDMQNMLSISESRLFSFVLCSRQKSTVDAGTRELMRWWPKWKKKQRIHLNASHFKCELEQKDKRSERSEEKQPEFERKNGIAYEECQSEN